MSIKLRAITLLLITEICVMSLWFVSAAILPDMLREVVITPGAQALLSTAVQAGFVAGALASAYLGIADRFDPRKVIALSAVLAALANAALLVLPIGGGGAIAMRFITGALLAGVYPVGMKIAAGWGTKDRGFLIGLLVGGLTLGSASPHLMALLGGVEWRFTIMIASLAAGFGGVIVLASTLGPHHARAPRFDPTAIALVWTDKRIRYAYLGYFGHMWELYAMWAWVGTIAATSYALSLSTAAALELGKLTAFIAIAAGALACVAAGKLADRIGKAQMTIWAMSGSGLAALAVALTFGGPVWLTFVLIVLWGITIIPDSAQFSALVADAAPPELAGSLMTLQTALGFALTMITVQTAPVLAAVTGWPLVIVIMALGPVFGIAVMRRLVRLHG